MTITVKIDNCRASEIIDIVSDLRREGHVQGVDFAFAYYPNFNSIFDANKKPHAEFIFYTEELALFFKLKYDRSK